MTIRFPILAALCVGVMQLLADDPGRELWSSPWTEVTPQNGVWDEYYRRTDDPANCSFRFRVMRYASAIGVEAFVRDDKVVVDDCPADSISCETWKDDCLEVFFDGDNDRNPNTRGPEYETNPTPCNAGGEYAIAANGSSQSDYASAKKCFGTLWGGTSEPWEEGGRRVGTYYRLWFRYECLGLPTPYAHEPVRFGFTICVHDDDDGGANDLALYWKGNPKIPYADESAFGTVEFPGRPTDRLDALVPVDWTDVGPIERRIEGLRTLHDRYGLRRFVLITPWRVRYCERGDVAAYAAAGRDILRAKEAFSGSDVEIGWWLAPSISASREFPGQRIMDSSGHSTYASCPLSDEFSAALCERVDACVSVAKPAIIFVEDDYTLSNHGGMDSMKGCFCPLHLAAYAKRVGKTWSAAEIAEMFRKPTDANRSLRQAFADLSRDSLVSLAKKIRATVDRTDPSIRICLCQSGFADIDGDSTEADARAFAGRTRPMARIFGAGYFSENVPADLPKSVAHTIWSAQHLPPDIERIHETDPYPHTRFYNSANFLWSELSAAVLAGVDGTYYYCTQYNDDPVGDDGYAACYRDRARQLDVVRDLRTGMKPCGIRGVYTPAEAYLFRETDKGAATGMLSVLASFTAKMGFPFVTTEDAPVAFLFGNTPNALTDEEIRKILSGGVLLDAEAAVLLTQRGYSELIGCTATDAPDTMLYNRERITEVAGCRRNGRLLYQIKFDALPILGWTPKKCVFAELKPRAKTEIWSELIDIDGHPVAPATTFCSNTLGGRVAVLGRSLDDQPHPSIFSERKQELLHNLVGKLGGELDVCAPFAPCTWVLSAKNDRALLVMVENLAGEPRPDAALRFGSQWQGATVECIRKDGTREKIGVAADHFRLPHGSFSPMDPEFLIVTHEKGNKGK